LLCPHVVKELRGEDWHHIVCEDFPSRLFLPSGLSERADSGCFSQETSWDSIGIPRLIQFAAPAQGDFKFVGYDLIEEQTQISALTNCGGFPDVFSNNELNRFGLIDRFHRACPVRRLLAGRHPEEPHAQCELYAIWRLDETEDSAANGSQSSSRCRVEVASLA